MFAYIAPFFRGLFLGGSVVVISFCLDRTVSKQSYVNMDIEDIHLYHQGVKANIINLCVMSPVMYSILVNHIVFEPGLSIYGLNALHTICLVFFHNLVLLFGSQEFSSFKKITRYS